MKTPFRCCLLIAALAFIGTATAHDTRATIVVSDHYQVEQPAPVVLNEAGGLPGLEFNLFSGFHHDLVALHEEILSLKQWHLHYQFTPYPYRSLKPETESALRIRPPPHRL